MCISKREYEVSLEEKIKLYLDIWVGNKAGHNILDIAKQILFFDMGMDTFRCPQCDNKCCSELLPLEKRIDIMASEIKDYIDAETIDKELLNLPLKDVKNVKQLISNYYKQIRLAKELENMDKH